MVSWRRPLQAPPAIWSSCWLETRQISLPSTLFLPRRQVSFEEAQTYAKKLGLVYIEVSAKTGQNISLAFEMITEKILEKIDNKEINPEEELGIKMGNKGEAEPTLKDRSQNTKEKDGGGKGCCPSN